MKTDNYTLIDIFENRNLEQFVIPEIQRDYVWESRDVLDLLNYIYDGFSGQKEDKPYLGFIYAYNHKDYPYKYFLIDGQQRITTIFLALLACYHKRGIGLPDYMFNRQGLKIEYKVRQATQDFLLSFVRHCKENAVIDFDIEDQTWYHQEYDNDRTIQNIIGNYKAIKEWLTDKVSDVAGFLKFMEEGIGLSYFKIEESRQGEDLYIYMNSRGRQLEPNETLKAQFLATTSDKEAWGTKWEQWQDFFWKHKGTRPDADAGFNDFLRMVQVLNMCQKNYSSEQVSAFASGKEDQNPSFEKLPQSINELGAVYEAYSWMVGCGALNELYKTQREHETYLTRMPSFERRQVYFLRILPVLGFLSVTGCRDEKVAVRFVRFFYNIARKSQSIGKDISNQLPAAIRLMLEYGRSKNNHYDVCDLIPYSKGRTVLIDAEEIVKLNIYKKAGSELQRSEIEQLFWKAEDHKVFEGEIFFLLRCYYDSAKESIDLTAFKGTWQVFEELFSDGTDQSNVIVALLYYENTWVRDSPYYYENYNCRDWYEVVRKENRDVLISLLEDLQKPSISLGSIIKEKIHGYFKSDNLTKIEALKAETRLFNQIKILAALDYHTEQKMFRRQNGYIAKDNRYNYGDDPFFNNQPDLFNVRRYISEGYDGRLMRDMKGLLQDNDKLKAVLGSILKED